MTHMEGQVTFMLNSPEIRHDPRNHTVPIVDVIHVPDDEDHLILVFPFLRIFDEIPFHCLDEFVEAVRQLLQVS